MRNRHLVLLAGALSALMACTGENNNNDGSTGGDASTDTGTMGGDSAMDTGHDTGTGGDSSMGGDTSTGGDATTSGTCTTTSLTGTCAASIDLNAMGTALSSGTGRQITGNNCSTPMPLPSGTPGPSCGDNGKGGSFAGHVVVFDYVMQGNAALTASTVGTATESLLDTLVWITDGCSASPNELGCDDDVDFSGGVLQSTARTAGSLTAGTHVKIFVAGYSPPYDDTHLDTGTFQLTVTEVAPVPAGGTCDDTSPVCVTGYSCVRAAGAASGTCNMNGTENASCNTAAPFCTGMSMTGSLPLGCTVEMPTASNPGVCLPVNPLGGPCTMSSPLCATGAHCIADAGSATMGHCIADGTMGGACRTTTPACDGTLTCNTDMLCM